MITRRSLLSTLALLPGLSFFSSLNKKEENDAKEGTPFKPGDLVVVLNGYDQNLKPILLNMTPKQVIRLYHVEVVRSDPEFTIVKYPDKRHVFSRNHFYAFSTKNLLTIKDLQELGSVREREEQWSVDFKKVPACQSLSTILLDGGKQ